MDYSRRITQRLPRAPSRQARAFLLPIPPSPCPPPGLPSSRGGPPAQLAPGHGSAAVWEYAPSLFSRHGLRRTSSSKLRRVFLTTAIAAGKFANYSVRKAPTPPFMSTSRQPPPPLSAKDHQTPSAWLPSAPLDGSIPWSICHTNSDQTPCTSSARSAPAPRRWRSSDSRCCGKESRR
eukprot:scaffold1350_cov249-Pinguiococcus_pyrenoidosus.AAC.15